MGKEFWGVAMIAGAILAIWLWVTGRAAVTWRAIVYGNALAPGTSGSSSQPSDSSGPQINKTWQLPGLFGGLGTGGAYLGAGSGLTVPQFNLNLPTYNPPSPIGGAVFGTVPVPQSPIAQPACLFKSMTGQCLISLPSMGTL
jgi:hypothetical protein